MADEKVISIATGRRSGGRKGMRVSVTRGACSLEFRLLPQTEPPPELPLGAGRQEGSSKVVPIRLGEREAERGECYDIDAANLRLNAESGEASQRVGTVEDGSDAAGGGGKRKPRAEGRARRQNQTELVLSMLGSPGGATLKAIMKATRWQAHSVRGWLSGKVSKSMGLKLESFPRDGERVYALRDGDP